jgi:hypothetical protein
MVPLLGCSSLLGIEDPDTGDHIDGGVDAIDAPSTDHLMFDVGDFQIAMQQSARVHVTFVHRDGTQEDVTATAMYSSDNEPIVKTGGQGVIFSADTQTGSATITASLAGAISATVKVSVKNTPCHPVINELKTAGVTSADEWVEIYNPCTVPVPVDGWTLDYRAATNAGAMDGILMVTLTGTMAAGDFRLFGGTGFVGPPNPDDSWGGGTSGILAGTSGAVGLRSGAISVGPLVDSVGYGTVMSGNPFLESTAAPAMSVGVSASRGPFDGKDDDDGKNDFKVTQTPTLRTFNEP